MPNMYVHVYFKVVQKYKVKQYTIWTLCTCMYNNVPQVLKLVSKYMYMYIQGLLKMEQMLPLEGLYRDTCVYTCTCRLLEVVCTGTCILQYMTYLCTCVHVPIEIVLVLNVCNTLDIFQRYIQASTCTFIIKTRHWQYISIVDIL